MTNEQLEILERLAQLRLNGLLTDDEFQLNKEKILQPILIETKNTTLNTSEGADNSPKTPFQDSNQQKSYTKTESEENKTPIKIKAQKMHTEIKVGEKQAALKKIFKNGILIMFLVVSIGIILISLGGEGIQFLMILLALLLIIYAAKKNPNIKNFIGSLFLVIGIIALIFGVIQFQNFQSNDSFESAMRNSAYRDNVLQKVVASGLISVILCVTGLTLLLMKTKNKQGK